MKWYFMAFEKYADFYGRSSRKEFWMFYLIHSIIGAMAYLIDNLYIIDLKINLLNGNIKLISLLYSLYIFTSTIAISVRKLHDVNKNGLWLLLGLIPLVS